MEDEATLLTVIVASDITYFISNNRTALDSFLNDLEVSMEDSRSRTCVSVLSLTRTILNHHGTDWRPLMPLSNGNGSS
jgi:hypothetical protein